MAINWNTLKQLALSSKEGMDITSLPSSPNNRHNIISAIKGIPQRIKSLIPANTTGIKSGYKVPAGFQQGATPYDMKPVAPKPQDNSIYSDNTGNYKIFTPSYARPGLTKHDMIGPAKEPLPKPNYNKGFVRAPTPSIYGGGVDVQGEQPYSANVRTWEDPEGYMMDEWDNRKRYQDGSMKELNRYLKNKVEPKIYDSYSDKVYRNPLHMSREAMVRRINALKNQQERDKRIRKALGN